ncbi:hypothetical protein EDC04DRAFT_2901067 [Pisolithus marmoratus]|nr:hypothetical protein EDC04DRAFT_2901067 [Pisolithus marmoratus]
MSQKDGFADVLGGSPTLHGDCPHISQGDFHPARVNLHVPQGKLQHEVGNFQTSSPADMNRAWWEFIADPEAWLFGRWLHNFRGGLSKAPDPPGWESPCDIGPENLQPDWENLQPVMENLLPALEILQPPMENLQLVKENLQPVMENLQPALEILQPVMENLLPALEILQPVMENLLPALEILQPPMEILQPALENLQPDWENLHTSCS